MLTKSWLIDDPIDFEYKKYLLLAYEKEKKEKFRDRLLYPDFTDIIFNKNYIDIFLDNIYIFENGKKEIVGLDTTEQKILYRSLINDSSLSDVKEIAVFGKEVFDHLFFLYSKLYNDIDLQINITGSIVSEFSLYSGYLVIINDNKKHYYEYFLNKNFTPEELFILELNSIVESVFYKHRYQKNYFTVKTPTKENFEFTIKPILKRKFIRQILNNFD